ncbi:MAG: cation transporter [Pseudomonadales bacterium]|nr:cation transporter [Pseudomonadales bacterium]
MILLTAAAMVVEIAAGLYCGFMALLASCLRMGSHAVALGITAYASAYARRSARNPRFSFGTATAIALGGFTGAIVLAVLAVRQSP